MSVFLYNVIHHHIRIIGVCVNSCNGCKDCYINIFLLQFCYKKHALIYIKSNIKCNKKRICSIVSNRFVTGWGTVIRTQECRSQSPMPYRLAIPQYKHICIIQKKIRFCKFLFAKSMFSYHNC